MEQNVNRPAHLMGAADAHAMRVEASDAVSGSWLKLTVMNVLAFILPLMIPTVFALLMRKLAMPVEGTNLAALIGSALVCLALQAYLLPGFGAGLINVALGHKVPAEQLVRDTDKSGHILCLMLLAILVLAVCALPGAAVLLLLGCKTGLLGIVLKVLGAALLVAGVVYAGLRCGLALFCMVDSGDTCPLAALMHSAKLMKGNMVKALRALIPPVLILLGLTAAVALLRWPLSVQRDILTDALLYAGTVAYVIYFAFVIMQAQALMANIYIARKE